MRLVEAVAAERLDLSREIGDDVLVVSAGDRLLDELADLPADELGVLLSDRLAQHVGFGERDAREPLRDAHHLFLIGDDAVRGGEDLLELRQGEADGFLAALATDVHLVHPRVERPGTHERAARDEIVEPVGAHRADQVRGERRLELEYAGRAAGAQGAVRGLVVERERLEIGDVAAARLDGREGVVDDRERREAEEVHLQHAGLLERVHVVLRHHHAFVAVSSGALRVLRADRDVVVERTGRDDDSRRVNSRVARQPFERDREVEQLPVPFVALVELAHFGNFLDRFLHREREVRLIRDQLRDRVGFGGREAEHAADVLDGGARLERPEGDDLAHAVATVLLAHVVDHLAAALFAEVHVDVGHRHALGVQEALEEQVELQRAYVGDAQGVRDERTGG